MNIFGIGVVFSGGRGINRYDDALRHGWIKPEDSCYHVKEESITDKRILGGIRRADRFSKMAVLAASDAVVDSGINLNKKKSSLGIIVSTAFGPHVTTFRFLDDMLEYGDRNASPTLFSHSVHNAAASYITSVLDSRGPTITLTQFEFSFHQALILARAWLYEERCEYVLVGSVDECGTVMEYICRQKLRIAGDGRIKPFDFSKTPVAVPGEGSVFFLTTLKKSHKKYCKVAVSLNDKEIEKNRPDMLILDADGIAGDEKEYQKAAESGVCISGYSPIFGSMMTGTSFNCTAAALMLKKQIHYACPISHNPYNINICRKTEPAQIQGINCIRYNCGREKAMIRLKQ
ncbi:beta-ketoacyl synthase chain length factor [bacterium]|nr:beta-ketoacyl synthase chain length factor [bacterium]